MIIHIFVIETLLHCKKNGIVETTIIIIIRRRRRRRRS
jgi:hypothetical protein